jgi:hypothetical protein
MPDIDPLWWFGARCDVLEKVPLATSFPDTGESEDHGAQPVCELQLRERTSMRPGPFVRASRVSVPEAKRRRMSLCESGAPPHSHGFESSAGGRLAVPGMLVFAPYSISVHVPCPLVPCVSSMRDPKHVLASESQISKKEVEGRKAVTCPGTSGRILTFPTRDDLPLSLLGVERVAVLGGDDLLPPRGAHFEALEALAKIATSSRA